MKKLASTIILITIISISFTSCKSTKGGCGLTSDAQKIETLANQETIVALAE